MILSSLGLVALTTALVAYILQGLYFRFRHAARARRLNCQDPVQGLTCDITGISTAIRASAASKSHQLPVALQETFDTLSEKHGRVVTTFQDWIPFFTKNILTIEPQNVQAMLALQFKEFSLGSRTPNFQPLLGNGIFAANGKQWEHSRALLRPQFVRGQVSDLDLEEAHVQNLMTVLERHLGGNQWTSSLDIQPLFFRLTLDSATEFLFGESTGSQLNDNAGTDSQKFAYAFDRSQHLLAMAGHLGDYYRLGHTKEFFDVCKQTHEFIDYFVQKALEEGKTEKSEGHCGYVFLNALAQETRDPIELRSQLLNILLAGRDTTASTLGWFFYTMAEPQNTHIYQRLRTIILEDFGSYRKPRTITFESLKNCQYLQYCINEILRLYPAVSVNGRAAEIDTTLPVGGGPDGQSPIYLKKGQNVMYSVHLMHRRKDIWGSDANVYKPERWRNRKAGWDFLPFNGGPRICIGQQFALTELAYVIVRMMQRIDAIDGSEIGPVKHGLTLINTPGDGVRVKLHFAE